MPPAFAPRFMPGSMSSGPLYATKTELGAKFRDIAAAEGVPAAVRWRAAQFKE